MEPYTPIYSAILINEAFEGFEMKEGDAMENLSRVNVLIGANNSGKSRFVRNVFAGDNFIYLGGTNGGVLINAIIEDLPKAIATCQLNLSSNGLPRYAELDTISRLQTKHTWKETGGINKIVESVQNFASGGEAHIRSALPDLINTYKGIDTARCMMDESRPVLRYYVPTLRGLRTIQYSENKQENQTYRDLIVQIPLNLYSEHKEANQTDEYAKRTIVDYFGGRSIAMDTIITGLHLYEESRRLLLGSLKERQQFRRFEEFIGTTFFPGQEFSIIPHKDDDVVHVRIGDKPEDEKPIHQLGDGIQAIIILTYPLFFHQGEHAIICYEEPETHLHPSMQRLFMETLLKPEFTSFQYFITTHSNHLLDMTAEYPDVSVYTFSRKSGEKEIFQIGNVGNECESALQLIGARASSVFLSNCTIWVEGITDRLYLRHYLKRYQEYLDKKEEEEKVRRSKRFREDYHYSFVEYGGGNIVHWSFLDEGDPGKPTIDVKRLCGKLFLVTDSDGINSNEEGYKKKKAERLQLLRENLDERYYCLECREVENLLKREVLEKTLRGRAVKGKKVTFKKTFYEASAAEYEQEPLSTFIVNHTGEPGRTYDSGTLRDKPEFCLEAIKHMETFDDLSPEAQALAKKLYGFIEQENR